MSVIWLGMMPAARERMGRSGRGGVREGVELGGDVGGSPSML